MTSRQCGCSASGHELATLTSASTKTTRRQICATAAARCGLLSAREIADRLDVALTTLGPAPRDAPDRHRTLRATIDWSHDLLTAEEQDCFARFAVFAGGATVEAAEAVTGAEMDTLDRLVAKSLLVRRHVDGRTRLGMLETVRAYAAERFAALVDNQAVRARHHSYFLALARRHGTDPGLTGVDRKEHFARLDPEHGNFVSALEWAAEQVGVEPLMELASALAIYWFFRHRYADIVEWMDRARRRPGGDPALRADGLATMSVALWAVGRTAEQRPALAEADAITAGLPGTSVRVYVLRVRAMQAVWDDRLDLAAEFAEHAEACARATGDPWQVAVAAYVRALTATGVGELRARVERAEPLLKETRDAFHLADLFVVAGHRALCSGSDEEAAEFLARAVRLTRELDDPFLWMLLCGKVGSAAVLRGDTAAAPSPIAASHAAGPWRARAGSKNVARRRSSTRSSGTPERWARDAP